MDYTDLRTEFIGLIYEGLLDYRLKRADEQTGTQVFLNIGREPVLPLARLEDHAPPFGIQPCRASDNECHPVAAQPNFDPLQPQNRSFLDDQATHYYRG